MRSLRANNNNKSLNIFLTDDLAENYFRSVLEKRKKKNNKRKNRNVAF